MWYDVLFFIHCIAIIWCILLQFLSHLLWVTKKVKKCIIVEEWTVLCSRLCIFSLWSICYYYVSRKLHVSVVADCLWQYSVMFVSDFSFFVFWQLLFDIVVSAIYILQNRYVLLELLCEECCFYVILHKILCCWTFACTFCSNKSVWAVKWNSCTLYVVYALNEMWYLMIYNYEHCYTIYVIHILLI